MCSYTSECRWQQGEEAEAEAVAMAMAMVAMSQSPWRNLCKPKSDDARFHAAPAATTSTNTTTCSCERQAWRVYEGKTSGIYTLS